NAPFSGGKFTLWEGGIRVPCLLRWPGVILPGTVSHQAVITMDLAPLILAACEVSPVGGRALDGVDVLPMITGKAPERERTFFWRLQGPLDPEPQKAARRGRWKYLCEGDTEMLFDLQTDPGEFRDLSKSNPTIVAGLKKAMREWERRMPPVKAPARLR